MTDNDETKHVDRMEQAAGVFRCAYAVRAIPRAGLAVLGTLCVRRQAAAGVWMVGGHVRGVLGGIVVLWKRWTGGNARSRLERTEWQQCRCLLRVNTAGLMPRNDIMPLWLTD